jgi:hypothetical protein
MLYDSEHAPPGQPMPQLSPRVNLAECRTNGRPEGFANTSPVAKQARGSLPKMWKTIIALVAVLAVGAVGYFVYTVFISPPV